VRTEVDAWAASRVGRIMKRDRAGVWMRMAPEWGVEPHVLAIAAKGVRVLAICADASRIEGWRRDATAPPD
jgi:limonene-1,2-epoxide hydrolase